MNSPPDQQLEKEISAAQLRKINLEVLALEIEKDFKDKTHEKQREKLDLEIASLEWQKSLIYRLSQFATIVTILATVATIGITSVSVWIAYNKFITEKQRELEIEAKMLTERTDSQYRSDLQQLLQYPINESTTTPTAVFFFQDLQEVVETGYKDRELDERRFRVGFLLSQLTRSTGFDISKPRNLEFDRKAMRYCKYYSDYLIKKPDENMDIISKYKFLLVSIHDKDPKYVEFLSVEPNDTFHEIGASKNLDRLNQIVYPFHGYKEHVELLNKSQADKSLDQREITDSLNLAFCWFYGATKNSSLTANIFGGDGNSVLERWQQCP